MKKYRIKTSVNKIGGLRFGLLIIFYAKLELEYPVFAYSPFELVIWFAKYQFTLSLTKKVVENE